MATVVKRITELVVGDSFKKDGELWWVRSIKEDANGYGVFCQSDSAARNFFAGGPYEVEVRDEKVASAGSSFIIDNLVAAAGMQHANGSIGESTGYDVDGYTEEKLWVGKGYIFGKVCDSIKKVLAVTTPEAYALAYEFEIFGDDYSFQDIEQIIIERVVKNVNRHIRDKDINQPMTMLFFMEAIGVENYCKIEREIAKGNSKCRLVHNESKGTFDVIVD